METNVKTEPSTILEDERKDWLEKIVSDTFDEFFVEISAPLQFHVSEEVNRDVHLVVNHSSKIYDLINSYHAFCKLCEQHFYTRSVPSDINSFFEKHLNTSYHIQTRKIDLPPNDVPIMLWKEKFLKGKCCICNMSNLDPFIIDTDTEPIQLLKLHVCVWDRKNRQTNEKFLRKLSLLKKYCGLKVFRQKYIKTVNQQGVCLLCGEKLPWPAEKASCHLVSDSHYRNFCFFLKKYFGFTPKDALNGFNLEMITRWIISHDPPVVEEFIDYGERQISWQQSNSPENAYSEEKNNFSFSPKVVLKSEEADFIYKGECLVCNMPVVPGHMDSERHRAKAINLNEKSFDTPGKYIIYCEKRRKRLRMIENFKRLKMENCYEYLPPKKSGEEEASASQVKYFTSYFLNKLKHVNDVFTARYIGGVSSDSEVFCEVCDMRIFVVHKELHLNSSCHKYGEEKWSELKASFSNEKFMETFLKIKNSIICLLCGIVLYQTNFFSHLKSAAHARRFIRYSNLNIDIPVSSAILIKPDFSWYCTKCNTLISQTMPTSSVKILKIVQSHWPCLFLKEKDSEPEEESEMVTNENQKLLEENQKTVQDICDLRPIEGKNGKENESNDGTDSFAKDSIDFKKVEKTLENIVNIFEEKMVYSVINRTASFISSFHNLRKVVTEELKKGLEKEPLENVHKESSSKSVQPWRATRPPSAAEGKKEIKEKNEERNKIQFKAQKLENSINKVEKKESVNKNETEDEEDHEVLIIEGLPGSKRKYKVIYSAFKIFGKIRYILFNAREIIVAFVEPGVAEIAAKSPNVFVNYNKVLLTVSTRKSVVLVEKKQPSLNEDLISLLQDCQKLMDFVLNLVVQAVTLSESPEERKREELVCNTIISAILEYFPHARCYPFGSRLSGLVSNSSDLDVFLDCGGMYEGFQNTSTSSEKKLVNKVARLLRKKKEITEMVVVDRARVPIVSFLHKPTLTRCDLSFKNGLSIQNTLLIKYLLSLDWRVRPLILFLKHWAKLNGLHGPPYFSSYAIAILVIYYLEQLEPPVLPTIESLQNSYEGRRLTIAGWDCSINLNASKLPKLENKDSFPKLLMGLFEFYANFDYNLNVISPLNGKLLPREAFSASGVTKLPMCYKRHILNMPSPIENFVNNNIVICVMDPFDLSYILTKSFTYRGLKMFIEFCQTSEDYLKKAFAASDSQE